MTVEQKVEMYRLKLMGHTFEEIGNMFGITKQCVQQTLGIPAKKSQWKYTGLSDYINEHGLSLRAFAINNGFVYGTVLSYMTGKRNPDIVFIKRILEITGMTFEEAFAEREVQE